MKLQVFENRSEEEKVARLRLIDSGTGNVVLAVVDSNGTILPSGNLLIITKRGEIKRCLAVSSNLGFQLDKDGRVKMEE